jgi:hypothetical protein
VPTVADTLEVSVGGKVYHVRGKDLRMWIKKRRQQLNGPKVAVPRTPDARIDGPELVGVITASLLLWFNQIASVISSAETRKRTQEL